MSHTPSNSAVLFLATGSATSAENVEAFVADIREGRPASPELLAAVRRRYQLIGGSPFMQITLAQARQLEAELARRGHPAPLVPGMCHCAPRIVEAVAELKARGITSAVVLILAPLHAHFNQGRYARRLQQAQQELGWPLEIRWIESWWREPKFLEAWEDHLRQALVQDARKTKVLFTAHSLPARVRSAGDPYEQEFQACATTLAERLSLKDWDIAFQSAGGSPEPWLGPSLKERLSQLSGYDRVVVAPIGFVCDNVEILYDLDIEARELAHQQGLEWVRVETLNVRPLFIEALADAAGKALS